MAKYRQIKEITGEELEEKIKKYSAVLDEVPVNYHDGDFVYFSKVPTDD